jgi:uncharacterized protein (DUF2345 family)
MPPDERVPGIVDLLGEFAAQHQALALDAAGSKALGAAIAADQPAVSITAPEGVALSTPKTIAGNAARISTWWPSSICN